MVVSLFLAALHFSALFQSTCEISSNHYAAISSTQAPVCTQYFVRSLELKTRLQEPKNISFSQVFRVFERYIPGILSRKKLTSNLKMDLPKQQIYSGSPGFKVPFLTSEKIGKIGSPA